MSKQKNGTCFMFFCSYKVDSSMNLSPARSAWVARVAVSDAPSSTFLVSCFVCSPHVAGEGGYFHRRFSGARAALLCCCCITITCFVFNKRLPAPHHLCNGRSIAERGECERFNFSPTSHFSHTRSSQGAGGDKIRVCLRRSLK